MTRYCYAVQSVVGQLLLGNTVPTVHLLLCFDTYQQADTYGKSCQRPYRVIQVKGGNPQVIPPSSGVVGVVATEDLAKLISNPDVGWVTDMNPTS